MLATIIGILFALFIIYIIFAFVGSFVLGIGDMIVEKDNKKNEKVENLLKEIREKKDIDERNKRY